MKEKTITIDMLAIMVEKGFEAMAKKEDLFADSVDKRFNDIGKRFTSIDKRFNDIDKRFISIDKRFDDIDKRFNAVDKRFDGIVVELKEIRKEINVNDLKHRGDIASLDFRVGKLEKKAGLSPSS